MSTDEIVSALRCCNRSKGHRCSECPVFSRYEHRICKATVDRFAADLIESLQAQLDEYDKEAKRQTNTIAEQHVLILELQGEIRRLQSAIINECDSCACEIANERDSLVREIERLKNELDITDAANTTLYGALEEIKRKEPRNE